MNVNDLNISYTINAKWAQRLIEIQELGLVGKLFCVYVYSVGFCQTEIIYEAFKTDLTLSETKEIIEDLLFGNYLSRTIRNNKAGLVLNPKFSAKLKLTSKNALKSVIARSDNQTTIIDVYKHYLRSQAPFRSVSSKSEKRLFPVLRATCKNHGVKQTLTMIEDFFSQTLKDNPTIQDFNVYVSKLTNKKDK